MATTPKNKQPVRLRMDKSLYYSTVHGERQPDDAHAKIVFYQDGLPFDGEGILLVDLVPDDKKELVERRLKKLNTPRTVPQAQRTAPVVADDDDDDGENHDHENGDGEGDQQQPITPGEVNLEAWLRGEANYVWFAIPAAIRARFNKNVVNKTDAVTFLVEEEKIITPQQLHESLKSSYVPSKV